MFSGSDLSAVALASLDAFALCFVLIDSPMVAGIRGALERALSGRPRLSGLLRHSECYGCLSFHLGWALLAPLYGTASWSDRALFGLKLVGPVMLLDFALTALDRAGKPSPERQD